MQSTVYTYPIIIKEIYLDTFGHMNNAMYLTLFEEARWDLLNQNGYGLAKIKETKLGPTILEINLQFLKELRVRDAVSIKTSMLSYQNKIARMQQTMLRGDEECCRAEIVFGLFSLVQRKLVLPTENWLQAIGVQNNISDG